MGWFESYLGRVLCKTRLIFARLKGPTRTVQVVSIFPPLVLLKNTAKGKEAFQGKFVVIVERIRLLILIGKTSRISAILFSSQE